jgi:hypothetical protein
VPALLGEDGRQVRLIESGQTAWPLFVGMLAATGVLLALLHDRWGAALTALVLLVLDVAVALTGGWFLLQRAPGLAPGAMLLAGMSLFSLRGDVSLARALWISGMLVLGAMGWLAGAWVSIAGLGVVAVGAALLVLGGIRWERRQRRAGRRAELPRARLASGAHGWLLRTGRLPRFGDAAGRDVSPAPPRSGS